MEAEEKEDIVLKENKEEISQEEIEKTNVEETKEETLEKETTKETPKSKKKEFLQFLKFLAFSISAGVIQLLSFELLYNWIGWNQWWPSYLISIILSVIWNFTFNRKFTFKSSNNVPIAMLLVIIYYCAFIPVSVFGGNALEGIGWNGTLVTVIMMVLNFATEFVWDKFIVFNDKIVGKIESIFKRKKKEEKLEEDTEVEREENKEDNQ